MGDFVTNGEIFYASCSSQVKTIREQRRTKCDEQINICWRIIFHIDGQNVYSIDVVGSVRCTLAASRNSTLFVKIIRNTFSAKCNGKWWILCAFNFDRCVLDFFHWAIFVCKWMRDFLHTLAICKQGAHSQPLSTRAQRIHALKCKVNFTGINAVCFRYGAHLFHSNRFRVI